MVTEDEEGNSSSKSSCRSEMLSRQVGRRDRSWHKEMKSTRQCGRRLRGILGGYESGGSSLSRLQSRIRDRLMFPADQSTINFPEDQAVGVEEIITQTFFRGRTL